MTSKVTPSSAANWDVTYSYDLLGGVINAHRRRLRGERSWPMTRSDA